MKLVAISVCVKYSDFFAVTAINRKQFDEWIIVTDLDDEETASLAKAHDCTVISTDSFYKFGIFNKFAAINEALKLVDQESWVLFLDSDIVLHPQTRRVLESLNLQEDSIYGMDRLDCVGIEAWEGYRNGSGCVKDHWLLHSAGLPIGSRLVHLYGYENGDGKFKGYGPVGFFQLAHRSSFTDYPQNSLGADHCDLLFARNYARDKRHLIPELFCIHLMSEDSHKGHNWMGRRSKPFGVVSLPKPKITFCKLLKRLFRSFMRILIMFIRWLLGLLHPY
jgi:glycosyltransferase involved in cell wall biosynthesis